MPALQIVFILQVFKIRAGNTTAVSISVMMASTAAVLVIPTPDSVLINLFV